MPGTARKIGNSGFCHIAARGVGKQIIFEEENDCLFFPVLLKKYAIILFHLERRHGCIRLL